MASFLEKTYGQHHHGGKGGTPGGHADFSPLAPAELDCSHCSKAWVRVTSSMLFWHKQGRMAFLTDCSWQRGWASEAWLRHRVIKHLFGCSLCVSPPVLLLSLVITNGHSHPPISSFNGGSEKLGFSLAGPSSQTHFCPYSSRSCAILKQWGRTPPAWKSDSSPDFFSTMCLS